MSDAGAAPRKRRGAAGARGLRLLSLLVLLVGAGLYLRGVWQHLNQWGDRVRLPFAPLVLPADLAIAPDLGVGHGAAAGRDVILVTLDTTRPDRLSLYGNHAIETPNLERLGREGVTFAKAAAVTPVTLPSHASILTGLYPFGHGARANGVFALDAAHPTLAGILAEHGYDTAAFVSSFAIDARFGLDRGFALYDDEMDAGSGSAVGFSQRRGDRTTDRAISWLRRPRAGPYFLWVHFYDPHGPYEPPEPHASRSANPYDGEIAFVDEQLGRLLDAAKLTGRPDPLIVVVADHGESLGEHGEGSHSYLVHEATIAIPMIMNARGVLPGGRQIDGRASQVDVLPTVLALLGFDAPAGLHGIDWSRPAEPGRAVMAESVEGRVNFGWRRLSALFQGDFKLVRGTRPALFDLARDPTETQDVATANAEVVARLERRLDLLTRGEPEQLLSNTGALGDAASQQLAALGYIVTGGLAIPVNGPGPDPRDQMADMRRVMTLVLGPELYPASTAWSRFLARLQGIMLPRNDEEVVTALESFAERNPDFAPTYYFLAIFYGRQNRHEDASAILQRLDAVKRAASDAR